MLSTDAEPVILRSLSWRSNLLSFAVAQIHHYLLYEQTFFDKSDHNRKLSFVTHLYKIVIFKFSKNRLKILAFFVLQNSKRSLSGKRFCLRLAAFLYYSHTALFKNNCRLSYMYLNEFIKLCDQLCILYSKIQVFEKYVFSLFECILFCYRVLTQTPSLIHYLI